MSGVSNVEDLRSLPSENNVLHTRNPSQNQYFHRSLENNLYKLHYNYKMLLKKHSSLSTEKSIGKHEEVQIETSSRNIVSKDDRTVIKRY
jgi:hypothetical protein